MWTAGKPSWSRLEHLGVGDPDDRRERLLHRLVAEVEEVRVVDDPGLVHVSRSGRGSRRGGTSSAHARPARPPRRGPCARVGVPRGGARPALSRRPRRPYPPRSPPPPVRSPPHGSQERPRHRRRHDGPRHRAGRGACRATRPRSSTSTPRPRPRASRRSGRTSTRGSRRARSPRPTATPRSRRVRRPPTSSAAARTADLVVEAVPERMELKRQIFVDARRRGPAARDPRVEHVVALDRRDRRVRRAAPTASSGCTSSTRCT